MMMITETHEPPPLNAARGILLGVLLSLLVWIPLLGLLLLCRMAHA